MWKLGSKIIYPLIRLNTFKTYVASIIFYGAEIFLMFPSVLEKKFLPIYFQSLKRCL